MKRIEQGRTVFEVDASRAMAGHVRLIGMIGHDGHIYTLTPETARALGQALIDRASAVDDDAELGVGSRVIYKDAVWGLPVTIAEIKSVRGGNGEISYRFRAVDTMNVDGTCWRRLDRYRLATPEDEKRAQR